MPSAQLISQPFICKVLVYVEQVNYTNLAVCGTVYIVQIQKSLRKGLFLSLQRIIEEHFFRLEQLRPPALDVLTLLLEGGRSKVAGRLAGAFHNIGNDKIADQIIKTMRTADFKVQEEDPFEAAAAYQPPPFVAQGSLSSRAGPHLLLLMPFATHPRV